MASPLLRYQVAMSLDGFIAPLDGSHQWLDLYTKAAMPQIQRMFSETGGFIMGSATFAQNGAGASAPTVLMTSRPPATLPKGAEAHSDPAAALTSLKARVKKGDIWLFGGGITAARFLDAGLIDTIELAIVPVALGAGRPLFDGAGKAHTLALESVQPMAAGMVMSVYRRH